MLRTVCHFLIPMTVIIHFNIHIFVNSVTVSIPVTLLVTLFLAEMIRDVKLCFRETPMVPHLHKLSMSPTVISEHAYCEQDEQYEDEAACDRHGDDCRLEPEDPLGVVL